MGFINCQGGKNVNTGEKIVGLMSYLPMIIFCLMSFELSATLNIEENQQPQTKMTKKTLKPPLQKNANI